ncbi:MAG: PQQ-binding-like beta-propeller repeat protein [Planctomycetota bacterium]
MKRLIRLLPLAVALACATVATTLAADWPTYRGDSRRSGYTAETLPAKLSLQWTYRPRHEPQPAWSGRDTRMPFDRAYHAVVAGDLLFFGSSADGKVYALDTATGTERWAFFTGAPVRFAPTVWKDRLFVVSDDGFLYCLAVDDGRVLWKLRGGPEESMILANDRIASRWPARGGPVIADGVVYFAAGIWPSEGIFVYALEAETGKVLWLNDESGGIYMAQPHGGANAKSGVSAQGHLVLAGDVLLVPTGRAVPAAFRRAGGELLYFHLQENTKFGGAEIVAAEEVFFNRGAVFNVATGARSSSIPALRPALTATCPEGVIHWDDGSIRASHFVKAETTDRTGNTVQVTRLEDDWSSPTGYGGTSLVVAAKTIVSAGAGAEGHGVATVDAESRQPVWSDRVDGLPFGLAVADGRLFVSTERGTIHCFGAGAVEEALAGRPQDEPGGSRLTPRPSRLAPEHDLRPFDKAAEEILVQSGVTEGYCLDLGCGDGALAHALATRTKLHVYAVDPDPRNVELARQRLDAAGLYGVRVTVHQGDPLQTAYPSYFANLVVSGRSLTEDVSPDLDREANRVLRPYGGVASIGKLGEMKKTVRGPLEGAGTWTHQYCDPANTNCSADTRVKGPLGMLWFTDLGFEMPSRHGRGRSPLFLDGRLFVEGLHAVLCVDPYNGRKLWEYPLPNIQTVFDGDPLMGVSGTGSNFCAGEGGVYIHTGPKCLRLDPVTGKLLAEFQAPDQPDGKPGTWGVIACVGDTLFGTLADTGHLVTYRFRPGDMSTQFTESLLLFAMDAKTGRLKWRYQPENSIRHNTIAIGNGRVHLIDRPMALGDRRLEKKRGVPDPGDVHPAGALVTLDAAGGDLLWKSDDDIYGTLLALSPEHETLLMCYQDWRFKLASELGGRMTAFDAATGSRRWDRKTDAVTRPILNGRTIYCQPGAWDLLTGEQKDFKLTRSYGCNIPAGSTYMMVFRSATLGYVDLSRGQETENYGGIRPACWINVLPVGGLVLMPDATDGCTCSYLIKASIGLAPYGVLNRSLPSNRQ